MTRTLDKGAAAPSNGAAESAALEAQITDVESPLERFLSELERMKPHERISGSRYSFSRWERSVWAGRYPDEVPLIDGEFEWIARNLE